MVLVCWVVADRSSLFSVHTTENVSGLRKATTHCPTDRYLACGNIAFGVTIFRQYVSTSAFSLKNNASAQCRCKLTRRTAFLGVQYRMTTLLQACTSSASNRAYLFHSLLAHLS